MIEKVLWFLEVLFSFTREDAINIRNTYIGETMAGLTVATAVILFNKPLIRIVLKTLDTCSRFHPINYRKVLKDMEDRIRKRQNK